VRPFAPWLLHIAAEIRGFSDRSFMARTLTTAILTFWLNPPTACHCSMSVRFDGSYRIFSAFASMLSRRAHFQTVFGMKSWLSLNRFSHAAATIMSEAPGFDARIQALLPALR
jgi:hypothetical protein